MSDDRALAGGAPVPGGEPLCAYLRRVVPHGFHKAIMDHDGPQTVGNGFPWPSITPVSFKTGFVRHFYGVISLLDKNTVSVKSYLRNLNHLWSRLYVEYLPYGLVQTSKNSIGLREPEVTTSYPQKILDLTKLLEACSKRDTALALLFDALRCGDMRATGFLAGDRHRTEETISSGWWDDQAIELWLDENELRPVDRRSMYAPPHYRGLKIHAVIDVKAEKPVITKWEEGIKYIDDLINKGALPKKDDMENYCINTIGMTRIDFQSKVWAKAAEKHPHIRAPGRRKINP